MNSSFIDSLPTELYHIISSYLNVEDINKVNSLYNLSINWEFLISMKQPVLYNYIRTFVKQFPEYVLDDKWKLLQIDIEKLEKVNGIRSSSILPDGKCLLDFGFHKDISNLLYSMGVFYEYPNMFKFREDLIKKNFDENTISQYMYASLIKTKDNIIKEGKLNEKYDWKELLDILETSHNMDDKVLLVIIFSEDPNFDKFDKFDLDELYEEYVEYTDEAGYYKHAATLLHALDKIANGVTSFDDIECDSDTNTDSNDSDE